MATTILLMAIASVVLIIVASTQSRRRFSVEGIIDKRKLGVPTGWAEKLPDIAGNHTQVAGALAGFSITVAVLIATFMNELKQQGPDAPSNLPTINAAALGLFIVSFFGYVATGITYSLVPEHEGDRQYALFSVASVLYMYSVFVSFTALLILLKIIAAAFLIGPIAFFVAGGLIGAYMAVGVPIYDLLGIRRSLLFWMFCVSVGIAGLAVSSLLILGQSTLTLVEAGIWFSAILVVASFGLAMSTFLVDRLTNRGFLLGFTVATLVAGTAVVSYIFLATIMTIVFAAG